VTCALGRWLLRILYGCTVSQRVAIFKSLFLASAKYSVYLGQRRCPGCGNPCPTRTDTQRLIAVGARGNIFETIGFLPEEAAILRMKTQLSIEVMRAIERKRLTARQLEKVLDVPQPRVSELLNRKISRMTAGMLVKYLYSLWREVEIKTKTSGQRTAAMA
jgi:predicted XRE-type DNA-binding protein